VSPDNALGAFLRARRERVRPDELGIAISPRRRATGLRREEVAALAGVRIAYYVRLEQGRDRFPSGRVLDALARALAGQQLIVYHADDGAPDPHPPTPPHAARHDGRVSGQRRQALGSVSCSELVVERSPARAGRRAAQR
jgi:hypothetical protein